LWRSALQAKIAFAKLDPSGGENIPLTKRSRVVE